MFQVNKRVWFALANVIAGVALVSFSLSLQLTPVSADWSGDCGTEEEPLCQPGEACCGGECYDPEQFICNCDETLSPI